MRLRDKQKQQREKQKNVEKQIRQNKRKWKYGVISVCIFLITVIPYAVDLARRPDLWNGMLFVVLLVGGCSAIILIIKHHR